MQLSDQQFKKLSAYIEDSFGIRMPPTKRVMLESRLHKRLRALGMNNFGDYLAHVFESAEGENELINMIDSVTTNKTDFFREPDHFEWMNRTIPQLIERDSWGVDGKPLKLWSAAASTGEEAYTIAIVLEELRRSYPGLDYDILATDLSTGVLKRAQKAVYPEARLAPISHTLRSRYFLRSKDRSLGLYRVKKDLRKRVRLKRLNLMDPDYGFREQFHIIFCRNVIIYFERPRQIQLITNLLDYLAPGGYLILGHSETLAGADLPVKAVAPTIYQRQDHD